MKITKIEIEVIEMTNEEESALWQEWKDHWGNGKNVTVCGCLVKYWNTDDGNNILWLKDLDGNERLLTIYRKEKV